MDNTKEYIKMWGERQPQTYDYLKFIFKQQNCIAKLQNVCYKNLFNNIAKHRFRIKFVSDKLLFIVYPRGGSVFTEKVVRFCSGAEDQLKDLIKFKPFILE